MINISVFVPTYRRPGSLVWALAALLVQRFDRIDLGRARLVVLNNDLDRGPVERAVERAVEVAGQGAFEGIRVVHRDPPMDPILSWWGGVREFTDPGDVTFIVGDDDVVLCDGLQRRARAIVEADADLLMNRSFPALLLFDEGERTAHLRGAAEFPPCAESPCRVLAPGDMDRYCNAFLGDQLFRTTDALWRAYDKSMDVMRRTPVEGRQKFANLPGLLPILAAIEGRAVFYEGFASVRGQRVRDILHARYGHTHWQPGVLDALTLAWLENGELGARGDLEPMRAALRKEFATWYLPSVYDRETRDALRLLGRASPRQFGLRDLRDLAVGAARVAKAVTRTQGLRYRLENWGEPYTLERMLPQVATPGAAR